MKTTAVIIGLVLIAAGSAALVEKPSAENAGCNAEIEPTKKSLKANSEVNPFFFDVGNRFGKALTKKEMLEMNSIQDFCNLQMRKEFVSFSLLTTKILNREHSIAVTTETGDFTDEHRSIIRRAEISDDLLFTAACKRRNLHREGYFFNDTIVYYATVVPPTPAQYSAGIHGLKTWIEKQMRNNTYMLDPQRIEQGRIRFIIDKAGTVADAQLESTCGFPELDKQALELLKSLPGSWSPAKDDLGNPVNQSLVFSFGSVGC